MNFLFYVFTYIYNDYCYFMRRHFVELGYTTVFVSALIVVVVAVAVAIVVLLPLL